MSPAFVVLEGLVARPALNGVRARVLEWHVKGAPERAAVQVCDENGERIRVKRACCAPCREHALFERLSAIKAAYDHLNGNGNGTKMVIHRVELLDERNRPDIAALMRAQSEAPDEVEAFLSTPGAAKRLVLWSRHVPAHATTVLRKDRVVADLVIGPGVDMTRAQFVAWHDAAQACNRATCCFKLVLDALLARGDVLHVPRNPLDVATKPRVVTSVQRVSIANAQLPINGFYLVDPRTQPEFAHRAHDGAFPVFYNGAGLSDDGQTSHTALCITVAPADGDGDEAHLLVDPTFRQVCPDEPSSMTVKVMGMHRVDERYGDECTTIEEGAFGLHNLHEVALAVWGHRRTDPAFVAKQFGSQATADAWLRREERDLRALHETIVVVGA